MNFPFLGHGWKEAQFPSQAIDSNSSRSWSREAPATYRKILANFYKKREWVYSVGELLPLPSQNSPKFMLTKALVSVPDRAFPRGKHEWVVRFGNETSGLNEVSPPFHLRTIKLLDSRVHSLTNSWLPGLHSITLASPKVLPWQSLRAGNAVTWTMIWIRTVSW